jgi:acetolactate synthase I/II/III large subunit
MPEMSGADLVVEYAIREQVPYIIGLSGHSLLPFLESVYQRQDRIKHMMVRHEHVATCLADGYFRATGRPLVVYLHLGPGLVNGLNGIATAALDSSAMVVITGNTWQRHYGRNASQETSRFFDSEQSSLVRPLVKRSWAVQRLESLPEILHKAFKTAVSGRPGPVHIDLPLTIQAERGDIEVPDPTRHKIGGRQRGDAAEVRRAAELLLGAKRPVIVCGSGAKMSGASPEILALAEHLAAPVGCAHRGKGVIPEDHPLALGLCGAEARLYANKIVADADVVLAVGMRFTEPDTSSWQPGAPYQIPPSKLIHIDIDPDELARYYPTEVAIWADAKAAVQEILEAVRGERPDPARLSEVERIQDLGRAREAWRGELLAKQKDDVVPIRPERLMKELREAIPRDGIVFVDTGKVKNWAYQQFEAYAPDSFYIGIGWTAMGHSPAAALGVKLAHPDRPVVAFVGDGGFQMVPWTLSTAVDYDIPVTTVIFNDLAYGAVRDIQTADYEQHYLSVDPVIEKSGARFNPDFAQMAELYGARGFRVEKPGQLGPALRAAMACGAPSVVDVLIDRDVRFPVAKQRAFRHLPKY